MIGSTPGTFQISVHEIALCNLWNFTHLKTLYKYILEISENFKSNKNWKMLILLKFSKFKFFFLISDA
jgi:hypothetical protein